MSSGTSADRVPQTRLPAAQRQEQLLDACRQIVDAEGFHAVTVDRIAQECGVTRPVIYQQFGNLHGMLTALVDRAFARAHAGFDAAMSVDPDAVDPGFEESFRRLMDAVDADPSSWRMFMFPAVGGPPELHERLEIARALARDHLVGVLHRRPGGDTEDADLSARLLHAAADEAVRLRLESPDRYPVQRLASRLAQLVAALDHPAETQRR